MLGTIKNTLKWAVLSHNTTPQMSQVLRERAIEMLTAGIFTRVVARMFNVNLSTISHLQCCFREFSSTSNRPHHHSVTTPPQDLHIQLLHRRDRLRPANRTADETEEYFCLKKALLWGKTHSDCLGLAPKWVGLCPSCTPAQS